VFKSEVLCNKICEVMKPASLYMPSSKYASQSNVYVHDFSVVQTSGIGKLTKKKCSHELLAVTLVLLQTYKNMMGGGFCDSICIPSFIKIGERDADLAFRRVLTPNNVFYSLQKSAEAMEQ